MVMDVQPSPQSVGREFVRQYYTLLNKAPNHLHRFYNTQSSFIHGGLDSHNREATIVVGQKNIHNRILQLNFRDCHAKISQVDAQATLGNGVVVQVTGELSNDGQPMRRFTQTFVLAAQTPKNYYVHNDIFRYQDLYSDDENEGENRSENDDEQDSEQKAIEGGTQNTIVQTTQIYYTMQPHQAAPPIAAHAQVTQGVPPLQPFPTQQGQVNGVVHDELLQGIQQVSQPPQILPAPVAAVTSQQSTQVQQQAAIPTIQNVNIPVSTNAPATHQNLTASVPTQEPAVVKEENGGLTPPVSHNVSTDTSTTNIESSVRSDPDIKKDEFKITDQAEKIESVKPAQNEPKTYANLFKSMNSSGSSSSGFVPLPQPSSHTVSQTTTNKQDQLRSDNIQMMGNLSQRSNSNRQMKDFTERRQSNSNAQFGDSHQLFLGNVPHHATEEELKILFSKFGTVIDLRIHSKPVSKVTGVRLPPNYGFITYEDPESVQNCLSNCPLYFPDNSPDGQKLNVEEKKTRLRTPNDMSRLSNNMSNTGGGNLGGGNTQRSGGSGGPNRSLSNSGGMMRGGGPGGNASSRNSTGGGSRPSGGGFTRNDSRGPSNRGGGGNNGNASNGTGGGNTYGRR